MDRNALDDCDSPIILEAIDEIRQNSRSDSKEDLIEATFEYVKEKVTFVEDETVLNKLFNIDNGVELLIKPSRLLSMNTPMGDCDDFSTLTKCLLMGMGISSSFTTVAADVDSPGKFSHVYVTDDETGVAIDTSHGKYLGWEAPNISRKQIWQQGNKPILTTGEDEDMMIGLGDVCIDEGGDGGVICYPDSPIQSPPSSVINATASDTPQWVSSLLSNLANVGGKIAVANFGQPQLPANTFIRNADGSIVTNQSVSGGLPVSLGQGLSGNTMLLVGGGLLLFLLLGKK